MFARQKIIFAASLILAILLIEGVLRIQYGPPLPEPEFAQFKNAYVDIYKKLYKKVHKKGIDVYVPQKRYYDGYEEFPAVKAPDITRIFIIGGSVAYNWNYDDRTPESLIPDVFFKSIIPDKNFEIINCGMPGYDSYRVRLIEKEILSYEPDLIIVLSGNNEYYGKQGFNLRGYYLNKFLRRFWVYRRLQDRLLQWYNNRNTMHAMDRKQGISNYEKNIRFIVRKAKRRGIPTILCTLPVNFRDCVVPMECPLDKQFLLGKFLLENEDYIDAIDAFREFLKNKPGNSFGYYFLGRAYDKMGKYQKAKENYLMSLELDYPSDRAIPSFNQIIRRVCAEEGAGLADLEKAFMDIAPHGLLGRDQFSDDCHWWGEYYSLVGEVVIKEIFQNNIIYSNKSNLEEYRDRLTSFLSHFYVLSLEEISKRQDYGEQITVNVVTDVIESGDRLSERTISHLTTLYLMDPDMLWNLRFFEKKIRKSFLEDAWGNEFMSDSHVFEKSWPLVNYHVGETYRRLNLYKESLVYFNEAIALDDDNYLPYLGKALVYHTLGQKQKARESIYKAEEKSNSNLVEIKYYKEILEL